MMKHSTRALGALATIALVGTLAACGDKKEAAVETTAAPVETTAAPATTAKASAH